jgi:hypothetical protein
MALSDDDSLLAVVIIPALGGLVGFLLLGPFGFFLGAGFLLVIGANMHSSDEKDERIAELEQRVEELEEKVDT